MRHFQFLLAALVLLTLQIVLASRMAIGQIAPDFPLLLVGYFALSRSPERSSIAGFVVGMLQDLMNPQLLGLNAMTKAMAGFALAKAGKKADPDNRLFMFALFGAAAVTHDFVYLLFFTGLDIGRFLVMWTTIAIPSALYTAIVGVLVHWLAMTIKRKVVRSFGKARH